MLTARQLRLRPGHEVDVVAIGMAFWIAYASNPVSSELSTFDLTL
jgi:hypothetical protein